MDVRDQVSSLTGDHFSFFACGVTTAEPEQGSRSEEQVGDWDLAMTADGAESLTSVKMPSVTPLKGGGQVAHFIS